MMSNDVQTTAVPVRPAVLGYADRAADRRAADRLVTAFVVVAVATLLGSGSVAWALLMQHR